MEIVHATAIAIDGKGVLLRGPSGSGKSDLALRLSEAGGVLIGDDRIALSVRDDFVVARVPETIAGKLENCGVGNRAIALTSRNPRHFGCRPRRTR